jgi:CheY-like chemotaxis protein
VVAANGVEVLEQPRRHHYDVILMDVQMPVMDGLEATRAVREQFGGLQPYIVAMTAGAMDGDAEACLEAGMNDYLSKPVRVQELQAALLRAGLEVALRAAETAVPGNLSSHG